MFPDGFGHLAELLRRSTVQVIAAGRGDRGSGSGVIWNADGLIVTNAHVARDGQARVELWDGRRFDAEVVATDPRRDLASLRIKATGLPAAAAGDSSSLRAGELVIAVGNPLGFVGALTTGVVHGFGPVRGLSTQTWVQASIRLAPGNSGGPLADAKGRVIGINTMVISGGVGLAVPSNAVAEFLRRGASPSLGIVVRPVNHGSTLGLLVLEISPNGAAAAASLMLGDVLTGVNGKPFQTLSDLSQALEAAASNTVTLQFLRGDRRVPREVHVRLPAQAALARSAA